MSEAVSMPAIVLFADLLGFSHQVESADPIQDAPKLSAKIRRFADEFSERGTNLEFYGKRVWAFSDSIVVAWYRGSQAEQVMTEFDANLFELSGIAFAQGCIMREESQLVRGGIGFGWLREEHDTVVGTALVRAARLEKKVETPFIAVDQELYDYYVAHEGRKTYHSSIDPVPDLFIPPAPYTRNLPALDYLMICLGEIDLTPLQMSEAKLLRGQERDDFMSKRRHENVIDFVEWHRDFVSLGLVSTDDKVVRKYRALRDHHNFRISANLPSRPDLLLVVSET